MKSKKASHVGVILSFVIFITFLIFLFSIFGSPIKFSQSKEPLLDYMEIEIDNSLTTNLTVMTISPEPTTNNCIQINDASLSVSSLKAVVKDKDNNLVPSKVIGDYLYIKWTHQQFFKIFYAEDLVEGNDYSGSNCYQLVNSDINSYREDYYFSEKKINKLISDIKTNYTKLKMDLGLPANDDFSISFTDAEGNVTQAGQKEVTTDIYSRQIPVQYFDSLAKVNSGFINLKVW
jgi:hypothetical protein